MFAESNTIVPSNKWYHQQIRKKIENKRQIGLYYKRNNNDKRLKFCKENSVSFESNIYDTIDNKLEDEVDTNYRSFGICGCYRVQGAPQEWAEWVNPLIIQPLFDCIDNLIVNIWTLKRCKYMDSYDEYLHTIHPKYYFSSHIDAFKPALIRCLHYLFYSKYVNIFKCDQQSLMKYVISAIKIIIIESSKCNHYDYCAECYTTQDRYGYLWDYLYYDTETFILETKSQIKSNQLIEINMINKYNEMYSKQNWSKYICIIINRYYDIYLYKNICQLILDFVSYEYPTFFYNHPKIKQLVYMETLDDDLGEIGDGKSIDDNEEKQSVYVTADGLDNNAKDIDDNDDEDVIGGDHGTLGAPNNSNYQNKTYHSRHTVQQFIIKKCNVQQLIWNTVGSPSQTNYINILHPSDIDEFKFLKRRESDNLGNKCGRTIYDDYATNVIGQFRYNADDIGYFWCVYNGKEEQFDVSFYDQWVNLWNKINNISIKIDCYQSISDIVKQQVINNHDINEIMENTGNKQK